eukprot:g18299.t1
MEFSDPTPSENNRRNGAVAGRLRVSHTKQSCSKSSQSSLSQLASDEVLVLVVDGGITLGHHKACSVRETPLQASVSSPLSPHGANKAVRLQTPAQALKAIKGLLRGATTCRVAVLSMKPSNGKAYWNQLTVKQDRKDGQLSVTIQPTNPDSYVIFQRNHRFSRSSQQGSMVGLCCPICGGEPGVCESELDETSDTIIDSARSDTSSEEGMSQASDSEENDLIPSSSSAHLDSKNEEQEPALLPASKSKHSNHPSAPPRGIHMDWSTFTQVFTALTVTALPPGSSLLASKRTRFTKPKPVERVHFVAETNLPTLRGTYRVRAYQDSLKPGRDGEYICIMWGKVEGRCDVPVRVHDQCFTAEVLGSMKCDCREQLSWAMDFIKDGERNQAGCGMVIYLPQEGRGIGLANKLRAYQMQEFGLDTVDANRVLGLPDDSREYECVPGILGELGIQSIQLITNNPRKVKRITSLGVDITARIPCLIPSNPHSDLYLSVKRSRMGHFNHVADGDEDADAVAPPESSKEPQLDARTQEQLSAQGSLQAETVQGSS